MAVTLADLHTLPLFDGCDSDDLRPVVDAVTGTRHLVEGDVLCAEGDKADRWWIVDEGMADVTVGGLYTATIGPGETIGELALLDGEPRGATVKAATDMTLHEVGGDQFLDALERSPRLAVALLRELAIRLRTTNLQPPRPVRPTSAPPPAPSAGPRAEGPREFDPRTPGFLADPSVHLGALREAGPVHWSEAVSSYFVTRYEDVHRLARSRTLIGSITTMPEPPPTDGEQPHRPQGWRMMIRRDGTDHTRLRRLVSKVFTPRAISQWQHRAETIVESLIVEAAPRDEMDVIGDYALRLPVQVISEMLGMPHEDTPQLRAWSRTLTRGLDPFSTPEEIEASNQAGKALTEYLRAIIGDKRVRPGDDILTALLEAEDAGDVLDDDEVLAQVILLYIAGHETTLNLIGNGMTHLFRFPDQLDRLRAEPVYDANAVEEVLRIESPAQLTRRITTEPVQIGDTVVPAGSHLTLSLASANHDPRKWGPTADVLDIGRPSANDHVSFGGGPHFCLGASLARMEGKVALPRLVRAFPRMAPTYDEPQWVDRVALRGVETLPVTLR